MIKSIFPLFDCSLNNTSASHKIQAAVSGLIFGQMYDSVNTQADPSFLMMSPFPDGLRVGC